MRDREEVTILSAAVTDAEAIATLSSEFGYPVTISEMNQRLTHFSSGLTDIVFVAELDFVVGWIHISQIQSLQSKPFTEIRGIVVSEAHRNTGIGTRLICAAENWAKDQGHDKIRVRTNIVRKQTLKFYQKQGYKSIKTQEVFDKPLPAADKQSH